MSLLLFRSNNRNKAHQELAKRIKSYPNACCTEDADETFVWDSQPELADIHREKPPKAVE